MVITSSKSSKIGPWGESAILSDDAQRLPLALEFKSVKTEIIRQLAKFSADLSPVLIRHPERTVFFLLVHMKWR